jgi:hypothetical protein
MDEPSGCSKDWTLEKRDTSVARRGESFRVEVVNTHGSVEVSTLPLGTHFHSHTPASGLVPGGWLKISRKSSRGVLRLAVFMSTSRKDLPSKVKSITPFEVEEAAAEEEEEEGAGALGAEPGAGFFISTSNTLLKVVEVVVGGAEVVSSVKSIIPPAPPPAPPPPPTPTSKRVLCRFIRKGR